MKVSLGAKPVLYPHPVLVIGTYDREGRPNVMTASWGGICSSSPPCITISVQRPRYTHGNLMERRAFTINIPSDSHVREADYCGMASGSDTDKFDATGLTPEKSALVDAPSVAEFPLVLECRLIHTLEVGSHTQFIGEIMDVKVDEAVLGEGGKPDIQKIRPFAYDSINRRYYGLGTMLETAFSAGRVFLEGR
jgi:flavin reductase (DIM6/NTAB) family NADH-FMN oxidoreductase RutF